MRNDPQNQTGQKKQRLRDQEQERNRTRQAGQQPGPREPGSPKGAQSTGQRSPARTDPNDRDSGRKH